MEVEVGVEVEVEVEAEVEVEGRPHLLEQGEGGEPVSQHPHLGLVGVRVGVRVRMHRVRVRVRVRVRHLCARCGAATAAASTHLVHSAATLDGAERWRAAAW